MSFGESVFPAGFNQKPAKEDLIIKEKHGIQPRYLRGKTLEGSRSHITEAEGHPLTGGAARPLWALPVSPSLCRFPTAFEDAFRPLFKSV